MSEAGVDHQARRDARDAQEAAEAAMYAAQTAQSSANNAQQAAQRAQDTAESAERRSLNNEQEIREIKRQMANIEAAIDRMSGQMAQRLEKLSSQNTKLMAANAAGFTAVAGMTKKVDSSVQAVEGSVSKNTSAIARMEYLRLYNEAKAPTRRINLFNKEIEQRFMQAVTSIHLNRELYNEHFQAIHDEADNKFRTIGDHIFKVYEEDFLPIEQTCSVPPIYYTEPATELDIAVIEERSKQLDTDLASVFNDSLEPILRRHSQFETNLSSRYAVEASTPVGDVAVPATLAYRSGGDAAVIVGAKVHKSPNQDFEFSLKENYSEVDGVLQDNHSMFRDKSTLRAMNAEELAQLKSKIQELAAQGIIRKDLVPGYMTYLDRFGMSIVTGGEGGASLKGKPVLPTVDESKSTALLQAMTALAESGGDPIDVPGIEGLWALDEVVCEGATAVLPEQYDPVWAVLKLPFPGARLRRALGVTLQEAEAVLRPFYLWNSDVLTDPVDEVASIVAANAATIQVSGELRRLGLYDQAHDDMLGGGVSSEVYAQIAESIGVDPAALATVPFVSEALSDGELDVQRRVASALKEQGTYDLMYALDAEHPEFGNDYLTQEQWIAALEQAGVTAEQFFESWYLTWLDEAEAGSLDAQTEGFAEDKNANEELEDVPEEVAEALAATDLAGDEDFAEEEAPPVRSWPDEDESMNIEESFEGDDSLDTYDNEVWELGSDDNEEA